MPNSCKSDHIREGVEIVSGQQDEWRAHHQSQSSHPDGTNEGYLKTWHAFPPDSDFSALDLIVGPFSILEQLASLLCSPVPAPIPCYLLYCNLTVLYPADGTACSSDVGNHLLASVRLYYKSLQSDRVRT
jgi:hypothetical protein